MIDNRPKIVFIKNYYTEKIHKFDTMKEAGEHLHMTGASVARYRHKAKGKVVNLFNVISDSSSFPTIEDPLYEYDSRDKKRIFVVIKRTNGKVYVFKTVKDITRFLNKSNRSIIDYVTGKQRNRKYRIMTYKHYKDKYYEGEWKDFVKEFLL